MSSLAFFIKESAFFKKEHAFSCVLKKRMQKNATFFWGLISGQKLKKERKRTMRSERKRTMRSERKRTRCPTLIKSECSFRKNPVSKFESDKMSEIRHENFCQIRFLTLDSVFPLKILGKSHPTCHIQKEKSPP